MKTFISPNTAKEILERNTLNRVPTTALIASIAEEIKIGNFVYNGESIIISDRGNLLDGQHRLMACVCANKGIEVNLVAGVSEKVMPTIDTGRARTAKDVFSILGVKNSSSVSTSIRYILERFGKQSRLSTTKKGVGAIRYSHTNLIEFYNEHTILLDEIVTFTRHLYNTGTRIITDGKITAFIYLFSYEEDSNIVIDFFREIMLGINISTSNVATILRNKLINDKISKFKMTNSSKTDLIIKAFRQYARNRTIKVLSVQPKEITQFKIVDINIEPIINTDRMRTLV